MNDLLITNPAAAIAATAGSVAEEGNTAVKSKQRRPQKKAEAATVTPLEEEIGIETQYHALDSTA